MTNHTSNVERTELLEQVILGGMIYEAEHLRECVARLIPEDFAHEFHRKLFRAMVERAQAGEKVDFVSMLEVIDKHEGQRLIQVEEAYAGRKLHRSFASQVSALTLLSDRRFASSEARKLAVRIDSTANISQVQMATSLRELADDIVARHRDSELGYVGDSVSGLMDRMAKAHKSNIQFGIRSVDSIMDGMSKGDLIILAARPSVGKSAISLIPAIQASRNRLPVYMISLEMTQDQVMERLISNMSGVPIKTMRGIYPPSATQAIDILSATKELIGLPIAIDSAACTPSDIDRIFQRAANAGAPIRLMTIDYLGLMQGDAKRAQSFNEYADVSKALKKLAIKHDATIFLLSQLNRQVSQYDRPDMRMLRESGSLEQDADRIIFLWRDKQDKQLVRFEVAKNRGGEYGTGVLRFDGATMRFLEATEERRHSATVRQPYAD